MRASMGGMAVIHDGKVYETETRNISLGGLFVDLAAPIPFGAPVRIVFRIATLKMDTEVDAVVRWNQPDGLGLQFGSLRALDVWGLNQLFKSQEEVALVEVRHEVFAGISNPQRKGPCAPYLKNCSLSAHLS